LSASMRNLSGRLSRYANQLRCEALSAYGDSHPALMRGMAMFPQVHTLPGAQVTTAVANRKIQVRMRYDAADMRRHVVRALSSMRVCRVSVRRQG
jgi:hypothetical protein